MRAWTSASNRFIANLELSIGDYVLSGGELAAAVVVDATMRLIPACWATRRLRVRELWRSRRRDCHCRGWRSALAARSGGCSTIRIHPSGGVCRPARPETCSMATTPRFAAGAANSSCARPSPTVPDLLEGAALSKEDRKLLEAIRGELGDRSEEQ